MLEQISLSFDISKSEYKAAHDELISRLVVLQQQAHQQGLGVVVLFEGWDGAGKGSRISDLMYNLDARSTHVSLLSQESVQTAKEFQDQGLAATGFYPFMSEFWQALGCRGEMTIYERGWYASAVQRLMYVDREPNGRHYMDAIGDFERQLTSDGYVVVKFFLHVSEDVQRKRLVELHVDPDTSWRVTDEQLVRLADYKKMYGVFDELLRLTDYPFARWTLINGEDKRKANLIIAKTLVEALEQALAQKVDPIAQAAAQAAVANSVQTACVTDGRLSAKQEKQAIEQSRLKAEHEKRLAPRHSRFPIVDKPATLTNVDHSLALEYDDYKTQLKHEQKRFKELELKMYRKRIPLMVVYEGDDAAGKGGNIKRVAQALDARAYTVFPSPAPTRTELLHPHLWRYWTRLPKAGHVGIYDRSWYGRVMVERVEGFASPEQWARAYDEINEFERELTEWGAVLIKFWVSVSRDEQLERFKAREMDPMKQWKITAEDWRNRSKYPQYFESVEDMFRLTSTEAAPWIILESDDKYYARVKALKIINETLEARLRSC